MREGVRYVCPLVCVCVYNPKALQREFVGPNSRRVEKRGGRGKGRPTKGKGAKRQGEGKANSREQQSRGAQTQETAGIGKG